MSYFIRKFLNKKSKIEKCTHQRKTLDTTSGKLKNAVIFDLGIILEKKQAIQITTQFIYAANLLQLLFFSENFLDVRIYFEQLNFERVVERVSYKVSYKV